jgi:hypothetical protein
VKRARLHQPCEICKKAVPVKKLVDTKLNVVFCSPACEDQYYESQIK